MPPSLPTLKMWRVGAVREGKRGEESPVLGEPPSEGDTALLSGSPRLSGDTVLSSGSPHLRRPICSWAELPGEPNTHPCLCLRLHVGRCTEQRPWLLQEEAREERRPQLSGPPADP